MVGSRSLRHVSLVLAVFMATPCPAGDGEADIADARNMGLSQEALLNNLLRSFEPEIDMIAEQQGKNVAGLTERLTKSWMQGITRGAIQTADVPGFESALEHVAQMVGDTWADIAREQILEAQRRTLENEITSIQDQINANAAARREEQEWQALVDAAEERRRNLIGPPKPNAFY